MSRFTLLDRTFLPLVVIASLAWASLRFLSTLHRLLPAMPLCTHLTASLVPQEAVLWHVWASLRTEVPPATIMMSSPLSSLQTSYCMLLDAVPSPLDAILLHALALLPDGIVVVTQILFRQSMVQTLLFALTEVASVRQVIRLWQPWALHHPADGLHPSSPRISQCLQWNALSAW